MKLLISSKDEEEALEAIKGGADIIDVKNPAEGSLGANFPWVIARIREIAPLDLEVSATIGDFPNLPGTASLAALGAGVAGANYVKVGLYGLEDEDDALKLARSVVNAVKWYNKDIRIVVAGYADFYRIEPPALDALRVPEIGAMAGADVVMIDTAIKDGKTLFDHIPPSNLENFTSNAHNYGLLAAFGGSLREEHLKELNEIGCDVVGIRGAACENGDRMGGRIKASRVMELKEIIRRF